MMAVFASKLNEFAFVDSSGWRNDTAYHEAVASEKRIWEHAEALKLAGRGNGHSNGQAARPVKVELPSEPWGGYRADRLLDAAIPPRTVFMHERGAPLFFESSTNQILAWRGVGKTNFALGLADAMARGGKILDFQADEPRRILYIDGELPLAQLQERVRQFISPEALENLTVFSPDCLKQPRGLNLIDDRDWNNLQNLIDRVSPEVVFLDSQSTLMPGDPMKFGFQEQHQTRLLALRFQKMCTIELHHTGKEERQRGLSKNDDALDIQIHLKKVTGWEAGDGLTFEMAYEKCRHQALLDKGYVVTLGPDGWRRQVSDDQVRVSELLKDGKSLRGIAKELDLHPSKVQRLVRKLQDAGLQELNGRIGAASASMCIGAESDADFGA